MIVVEVDGVGLRVVEGSEGIFVRDVWFYYFLLWILGCYWVGCSL